MRVCLALILVSGLLAGSAFAKDDADQVQCGDHVESYYHGIYTKKDGSKLHLCVESLTCTMFHMKKQELSPGNVVDVVDGLPTEVTKDSYCEEKSNGHCPSGAVCKDKTMEEDINPDKIVTDDTKPKKSSSDNSSAHTTHGAQ